MHKSKEERIEDAEGIMIEVDGVMRQVEFPSQVSNYGIPYQVEVDGLMKLNCAWLRAYGYCGPDPTNSGRYVKFDRTDGVPSYYPASPLPCTRPLDANANSPGAYINYSPRNRNEMPESITVYLHEQHTLNTIDRFSLFFIFPLSNFILFHLLINRLHFLIIFFKL